MTRRLLALLAAAATASPAAVVAAPPADELPHELRLIPPDAGLFVHLNVAALYDSKLGEAVKASKSRDLTDALAAVTKMTGGTLADVKTYTFAWPSVNEQIGFSKGLSVVTFRKKYDREKVVAALKAQAEAFKGEFAAKDNLVTVTAPAPPDQNKLVITYDLTDPTRIVTLHGLGTEHLKPAEVKGLHTETLRANAGAAALLGVNFNALPEELRGENLPAQARPFQPIFHADGMAAVVTLTKDALDVSLTVRSKNKGNAVEVEKSLDALRQLADGLITGGKKDLTTAADRPKDVARLLDVLQKAMADAKFAVSDKTTTATVRLPLDAPYLPFVEMIAGGALTSRQVTSNNLKQLGLAVYNYESAYGHYPPPATLGKKGKRLLSWRVEILPYIEQEALYKKFNHDEPWDSEHNLKVFKENPMPKVFAVPGTTNSADKKTHFQVFVGNGALFDHAGPTKPRDISDGTSNTLMIAAAATAVEWTKPEDIEFDPKAELLKLLLVKDGVILVAMGDAAVRALSGNISEKTLKATVTRAGGEVLGDDF